jgi:2-oxoglutarate ferredoxin oxidoreductase subunit alpha
MTYFQKYHTEDAHTVLISYGAAARSARHLVENRRRRGEKLGLLELQTLWPFPSDIVRETCKKADFVVVVELNTGQLVREVKLAVDFPERVYLANRIDGQLISPTDIQNILRLLHGKGV